MVDLLTAIVLLVIIVAIIGTKALKIVKPYEKALIERMGRYQYTAGSGLTTIIPFVDTIKKVDMRETVVDVPPQDVITKDNVVVTVDAVVYYQVTEPKAVVYNVGQFNLACTKLAQTNLRNIIGDLELDQTLTSRERINTSLRAILDEATDKWGVKVNRVEIQKIDPPADVTEAMHKQMKAEREKRAAILEADGQKQSRILEAEGQKEAQIRRAEGEAEAIKQVALAERDKFIYEAQGKAQALATVFAAIKQAQVDKDILSIQYLDTLRTALATNSKFVIMPLEFSELLKGLKGMGGTGELLK
ncbi:MAG: SPFH domain-containing protein [Candidatus Undinarchaeales archaeon]|jgi:regulator of protease activity HflC (stomatin/prohibitin superfamily)|nr:SPFH domain-containing protein [Candidatus Undinarchaeales archaeon]MDP7494163.1 SPFH domain-containing protein [Candidatus Undinarchaeales archaeon]